MTKALTFAGIENYDLEIYLSFVLCALNKSVLLVDNAPNGSLSYCCPAANGLGDGVPTDFCGVTFARNLWNLPENYEWAIIDYGYSQQRVNFNAVDYIVTDYQKQNVQFIQYFDATRVAGVILRDRIAQRITPASIAGDLEAYGFVPEQLIAIEDNSEDLSSKAMRQYGDDEKFTKLSQSMKNAIFKLLSEDFSEKELLVAFKSASRRK